MHMLFLYLKVISTKSAESSQHRHMPPGRENMCSQEMFPFYLQAFSEAGNSSVRFSL